MKFLIPIKKLLPRRLHQQLVTSFLLIYTISLAIYAWYVADQQSEFTESTLKSEATALAKSIATLGKPYLLNGDYVALEDLLILKREFPGVLDLTVTDAVGRPASSVAANTKGQPHILFEEKRLLPPVSYNAAIQFDIQSKAESSALGNRATRLIVWAPIYSGNLVGWVRVSYDLEPLIRARIALLRDTLAGGVAILLLTLLIVTRFLKGPIRALERATEFAKRLDTDYGETISIQHSTNEIENLYAALNRASTRLAVQHSAIVESEARNGAILQSALDCIISMDHLGKIIEFNPAAEQTFGYTRDEILGMDLAEAIIPPHLRDAHRHGLQRYLASGQGRVLRRRIEVTAMRKGGEEFSVELAITPINVGAKQIFTAYIRDITMRKRADAEVSEAKNRLDLALQGSSLSLWDWNVITGEVYLDPSWARLLGEEPRETITTLEGLAAIAHPDDFRHIWVAANDTIRGKRHNYQTEHRVKTKTGEWRWIQSHGKVVQRDANGRALRMTGTNADITQRKYAEEALRDQLHFTQELLEVVPTPIYIKDRQGRYMGFNKAAEKFLGISRKDWLGKTAYDLFPIEVAEFQAKKDQELFASPGSQVLEITVPNISDGSLRNAIYTKATFTKSDGTVAGLIGAITDITKRKQDEEELRHAKDAAEAASRAKSDFLANMSHEIRTPMNGVIGMTDLLMDTELTMEQKNYLSLVKSSADALLTIINDILDFSKIEAGKLQLEQIDFALRANLFDTIKTLALRAHQKNLELVCDVEEAVPDFIGGDSGRLRQIIVNLVGNAIKFTDMGEVVLRVSTEQSDSGDVILHFSVRDTGIGIAADKQAIIFESFSQADTSTTRQYGGTGLGLTICARLVEMMGGKIWVESELGQGSTFHFTARFVLSTDVMAQPVPSTNLRGFPVLVVDDNDSNRDVLVKMLGQWGMEVAAVENGQKALTWLARAKAQHKPLPMLLLDAAMPEKDGFKVIEELNAHLPGMHSVMMLSSVGQRGDAALCRKLGVSAHVIKPVAPDELCQVVDSLLGRTSSVSVGKRLIANYVSEHKRSLSILLAEDNRINQILAVKLLEKLGHQVTVANNGNEALMWAERGKFDLIFMDVQMPVMGGFEATTKIRQMQKRTGSYIPIIAMTAHAMQGDREKCLAAGMDDYISKPIQFSQLAKILEGIAVVSSQQDVAPAITPQQIKDLPFDMFAALELMGNDEDLFRQMANIFLRDHDVLMSDLDQAVAQKDCEKIYHYAHTIKGCVGTFSASKSYEAALRLENLGKEGLIKEVDEALAELQAEMAKLIPALEKVATGDK